MTAIRRTEPAKQEPPQNYIYDIESYPNFFSLGAIHAESRTRYCFELSERIDQSAQLEEFLTWLQWNNTRMVGFNNEGYDYPVIHYMMQGGMDYRSAYYKTERIISSGFQNRFANIVWPNERFIRQVDLYKIHHFDNMAKATSLKALEFAMKMNDIRDLPYEPGKPLSHQAMQDTIDYMEHDIDATFDFYNHSQPLIKLRDELSDKYNLDHTNFNDTKIGKQYFVMKLEEAGIATTYHDAQGKKRQKQTERPNGIKIGDLLFNHIQFSNPNLKKVVEDFRSTTAFISPKGKLTLPGGKEGDEAYLHADCGGITLDFGLGGIHGSVDKEVFESNENFQIIDVDVTSYYPSVPIAYRIFPEHLGEKFCDIYADVKATRLKFAKGTPENAVMKLALNGVYGDSNNQYSCFYDPQYTLSVTVNGQLMLAMLCEWASTIPDLQLIQANTDGITAYVPRKSIDTFMSICKGWEEYTKLDLEYADYSRMWVRDVNNYVSEYEGGKTKQKGAYVSEVGAGAGDPAWHKDHSQMVVPKIAVKYLQHGGDIMTYLKQHPDMFDFMLRAKVRRTDQIVWNEQKQQKICRYYVSQGGSPLRITRPMTEKQREQCGATVAKLRDRICKAKPGDDKYKWYQNAVRDLAKNQEKLRTNGQSSVVCGGRTVQLCNSMQHMTLPIDFDYYVEEVRKLVDCFST